jgi:DNA-binding LacI/PurR family transcriptional regulator
MSVSTRQDSRHLAESASLPIAVINRYGVTGHLTRIVWDDRAGVRLAVDHLVGLGHTRIGFIAGPDKGSTARLSAIRRLEGFRAAHRAAGFSLAAKLIVPGDYTLEAGVCGAERLCRLARRPTALLASNDTMAMGAIGGILRSRLRCPEDVAVVGIGDPPFMAFAHPPLTTVALPVEEAGGRAAESVLEQIENPGVRPRTEVLPCRLVVRASCGAASLATDRAMPRAINRGGDNSNRSRPLGVGGITPVPAAEARRAF